MTGLKDKKFLIGTIIITCIVLVSSRSFMAMNANSLSADHAIHILMTHDLVLPDDLYFWGQDRLGSIVPIFAHGLLRLFSLPPVVAVSWAQYFFLLLGFLAFASLLNNPGLKVVFALVWFLPLGNFTRFVEISHPYGPQMAFVGLAIVFARQLSDKAESLQPFVRQLLISALTASWFISIWISDFSVVLAFCFGVVIFGTSYRQTAAAPQIKGWRRFKLDQMDAINISGVSILAVAFLIFAKQHAANPRSYALFNSFSRTFSVISALVNSAINTLTFRASPSLSPLSQI
ncbi:MAG: hypothetical protein LH679_11360, partial [Cyanobacteria bacterium CAN_BIN43]|nr:hypothetical protein [Cyanobacteria bacterium CAN_BIN43]